MVGLPEGQLNQTKFPVCQDIKTHQICVKFLIRARIVLYHRMTTEWHQGAYFITRLRLDLGLGLEMGLGHDLGLGLGLDLGLGHDLGLGLK